MNCNRSGTLDTLRPEQRGIVVGVQQGGASLRRLRDMGITSGTAIECVLISPFADPKAYKVRGTVIALRNSDAGKINILIKS